MAIPEAVAWKCSVKRVFFKISKNAQDNSCLIKLLIWGLQLRQRREFFLWVIGKLPLNYLLNLVWFTCEVCLCYSRSITTSPMEIFTKSASWHCLENRLSELALDCRSSDGSYVLLFANLCKLFFLLWNSHLLINTALLKASVLFLIYLNWLHENRLFL